jgi:glutamate 5-kinase
MRIVVKIGTNLLTSGNSILNRKLIEDISAQLAELHGSGNEIILVTSGAIGAGLTKLNFKKRPKSLRDKQSAAAVGQPLLMQIYGESLGKYNISVAQVLLTSEDFEDRNRYLNMRNTMLGLLRLGVIPVVNENDTVSVEEIKFGDNDTLSALVSSKVEADMLIVLTDVDGLCTDDPRVNKDAELIPDVKNITPEIEEFARKTVGSYVASGGMSTKIQAAKIATASGVETIIANGCLENVLIRIIRNREKIGTRFLAQTKEMEARKRWIAFGTKVKGKIVLDDGAVEAIAKRGKSLLSTGIAAVEGTFSVGDTVSMVNRKGEEIARGLVYYGSNEIDKIKGKKSSQIEKIIGRFDFEEVIHRDNLVVLTP